MDPWILAQWALVVLIVVCCICVAAAVIAKTVSDIRGQRRPRRTGLE